MFRIVLTVLVCGHLASSATAGIMFTFSQSNYDVAPNQTVDVDVYLYQADPTGDPVDLAVDGLISGGVSVLFNSNPPTQPAFVASLADITPNPLFDDTLLGEELFLNSGVSAGFADGVDDIFSPLIGSQILLGTIRFTAGGVAGEVTNLIATRLHPSPNDVIVAGNFTALDSYVGLGQATITVSGASAVPEPSTGVLFVLGLGMLGFTRHRRQ